MPPSPSETKPPKFTRGEKCLFVHLLVTLGIIILMIITYFVHLCVVNHTRNSEVIPSMPIYDQNSPYLSEQEYVGVMFVNATPPTVICNTLLLAKRWSLAPAQCTSMRDDPDLSIYLLHWTIKYKINGKHSHTSIKRTLTHSQFSRGNYQNNIGLFEHAEPIYKEQYYVAPKDIVVDDESLEKYQKEMAIIDWEVNFSQKGDVSGSIENKVRPILSYKCGIYANSIVELRPYEFCVNFQENKPIADHGAVFVMNSKIIGFFSWGDIEGRGVPLIILNILHFREWFESITY
ncbi:hypothetical protein PYW08_000446 [Mythimna loreyi]|uniref:Uncharacterized protein n=1 Tax=Mythimna loreyi TaxID=667449 RepID=A0ACC2RCG7_9NEOP|nr:hypothetical protein PYW08_000446 [Mythimna loreyi]